MCLRQVSERDNVADLGCQEDEAIAIDYAALLSGKADALEAAVLNGDSRLVAVILRSFKKQHPARQERLLDCNGLPADSYTCEIEFVRDQFKSALDGQYATLAGLLNVEQAAAVEPAQHFAHVVRSADAVPTRQQVITRHAAARSGGGFSECLLAL